VQAHQKNLSLAAMSSQDRRIHDAEENFEF